MSKTLPEMITCECGQMLNKISIQDAYGKPVPCDNCESLLKTSTLAYDCINRHCYCLKCSASLLVNVHNKGLVNPIHCACQEIMILSQPFEAYGSSAAYCNNTTCTAKIGRIEYCYHCPKGKSSIHPKGYDYCMKCAKQKSMFGYVLNKSKKDSKTNSYQNAMYVMARSKIDNEASSNDNDHEHIIHESSMPLLESKENAQLQRLREKSVIKSKDLMYIKNALMENIKIQCACSDILVMTKPYTAYKGTAECDICNNKIAGFEFCFHCPKEKISPHLFGFDVCLNCAIGNKMQFMKFEDEMKKQCFKLKRYEASIKPEVLTIFERKSAAIQKSAESICEIMPYMIETQNIVFNELIARIKSGMDEIPGINVEKDAVDDDEQKNEDDGSDSNDVYDKEKEPLLGLCSGSDMIGSLSLKQLYAMRNVLVESVVKYESMGVSINNLSECINYKINDMECEWEEWSADEIVDWIMELDNGRFVIYEDMLRKELNDGDATGAILPHLDISDWRKSFSIKNWKDAVDLNKYKDVLVTNKKEQPQQPPHVYVSPFDPAEEGANTK